MINEENPWGFGDPPTTVFIFIGESEDGDAKTPWYKFDYDNDRKISIEETALYGRLVQVKIRKKVFKGKEGFKAVFYFETPLRKYAVQSGVDSTFTRKLLFTLEQVQNLDQRLCLGVQFGNDTKVVFPTLWDSTGQWIKSSEWDEKRQLLPLIQQLQKRLGQEAQTIEQVRKEFEEQNNRGR